NRKSLPGNEDDLDAFAVSAADHHRAATRSAICSAIRTAVPAGCALHVFTSMITLFSNASARSHAHPGAAASLSVDTTLSTSSAKLTGPGVHTVPVWVWVYSRHPCHCCADASRNARALSTSGYSTTACLA